ncbi:tetraprenyl-beta-curcumene synthase family protein [Bacillota bacterium LX-D]|nr:tetraprenyl-beta-curcumene synthase family protein [Bacillota bacterium LX-D]
MSLKLVYQFVRKIFPLVTLELKAWENLARKAPDQELGKQAVASLRQKKFHAQGGSIFALYPGTEHLSQVKFIVALQTISDYLDNLCDRGDCFDGNAFRRLHQAMLDALRPGKEHTYYEFYPRKNDGGYLAALVGECQKQINALPNYSMVQEQVRKLAQLYTDLQTYKHVELSQRENLLTNWAAEYLKIYPELSTWEFAAATGSTLGIFVLSAAAHSPFLTQGTIDRIYEAYFPWIGGLHILLDYFIDQEEDRQYQDFNFVAYYQNSQKCQERLSYFYQQSLERARKLPNALFHVTVLEGLLALYLSDPKAQKGVLAEISKYLLQKAGKRATLLYNTCKLLRFLQVI